MISLPPCTCDVAKHFDQHNQLIKLIQFLIGLGESYLAIRSNLLTREPLPSVKTVFSVISGEESHRNISSIRTTKPAATAFVAKTGPNPNMKCTNCNKIGHTMDRCFEIIGYPAGYVKKNFNSNSRPVSSNNASADPHSNGVSSNNAMLLLATLLSLFLVNS
ncbi:ribonuclease H-like domain-containing protein [Tanacetum coccineum]